MRFSRDSAKNSFPGGGGGGGTHFLKQLSGKELNFYEELILKKSDEEELERELLVHSY